MELGPGELTLVRPRAWSMRTELRRGDEVIATFSPPRRFGRSVAAYAGGKAYLLSKGGGKLLQARLRERGAMDDIAVLDYTGAARGRIALGGSTYELFRTEEGAWELRSPHRGLLLTVHRSVKDPSQGRVVVDISHSDLLPLLLLSWFAIRALDC